LTGRSFGVTYAAAFQRNGAAIIEHALDEAGLGCFERAFAGGAGRRHHAIPDDLVQTLRRHTGLSTLAERLQGAPGRLVRIVAFDKTPEANWFVPWHQDRSIAVAAPTDIAGFVHWTIKDGAVHVEPPVALLEHMVTLRLHVDDCTESDGPLEVILGSHLGGRLEKAEIAAACAARTPMLCLAVRGDILAMRPLTVHRSQRAQRPSRRRVLHLEYCFADLPPPLIWAMDEVRVGMA
jgi:Phytanoyl-CoA dioxygenase (PhyH)